MRLAFIQERSFEQVDIHYLAGSLRDNNIEYQLFIKNLEKDFYGELIRYNPSYIFYSMSTDEQAPAIELFGRIKELLPGAKTLLGGSLALLYSGICRTGGIDYVFRGGEEFSLPKFIKTMEAEKSVKDIAGICFIDEKGQEYRNDNFELGEINNFPKPDRDLYYKYDRLRNDPTKRFTATRGCLYRCKYCQRAALSKYFQSRDYQYRDNRDVIEEIRYVHGKYGLKWVHFMDGTFNANKKWCRLFLEDYARAGMPHFLCNARTENVEEEFVQLLKKAGCERITFGIQSGDPGIRQKLAGRPTTDNQIIEACRLCKKYGIRTGVDIIFGWPGETLKEAMNTIRLCRKLDVEFYSSNILTFFPGLEITDYAFENGFISKIPALEDLSRLNPNRSLLVGRQKKILINMDKFSYYMIKFPAVEKVFLFLLRLPPNRLFFVLKNMPLLFRGLKYNGTSSKFKAVRDYITTSWKYAGRLSG